MNERWKPNHEETYYYISESLTAEVDFNEYKFMDKERIYCGNCFKTEAEAEAAAEKVKALLLSLHEPTTDSSQLVTNCNQLPKLTTDVFDHPDCPEWAKWAAINADGRVAIFSDIPNCRDGRWFVTYYSTSVQADILDDVMFDSSDWQNSLVERHAEDLPKLTAEVFDRPDCPKWAKYAAVDKDGRAWYFEAKPSCLIDSFFEIEKRARMLSVFFDSDDWKNSLIERPARLPDWCKVGEWVYETLTKSYAKVKEMDTGLPWANSYVTVRFADKGYVSIPYAHTQLQLKQARLRPWTFEEAPETLKVKHEDGHLCLITLYFSTVLQAWGYGVQGKDQPLRDGVALEVIANSCTQLNGKPCGVLEHFENGEWVE